MPWCGLRRGLRDTRLEEIPIFHGAATPRRRAGPCHRPPAQRATAPRPAGVFRVADWRSSSSGARRAGPKIACVLFRRVARDGRPGRHGSPGGRRRQATSRSLGAMRTGRSALRPRPGWPSMIPRPAGGAAAEMLLDGLRLATNGGINTKANAPCWSAGPGQDFPNRTNYHDF
ncbi:hypothetical protein GUJ93_ZPchr0019g2659 [Zizania palustris]|uniref:Uncharacterized protein n=1 Tax=Zizania palustris TaxID=103762 RepID=A0A8J5SW00_ZIZPA|nr:hypothetical protein GUJ93_ZPchr0001g29510 [Zizania palustris]KAG8081680.1 hypothetical protein GUJ93_ZPchr0019g2659 [Zizania palustris]